jgi:hypothetical protein
VRIRDDQACGVVREVLEQPRCPVCEAPIGVYEPLWRAAPRIGSEQTSWLELSASQRGEPLWHVECAEAEGIDGG